MTEKLLEVKDLKKHFPIHRGIVFRREVGAVKAVDGISFDVLKGETLGLVGESGCGKSTTGRLILRLIEPTSGSVRFGGTELVSLKDRDMRPMRRRMQIVFQNPYGSLDPRMMVGDSIAEPLRVHKLMDGKQIQQRVKELLERVGMSPTYANRYPHEFSGGQRQRIGIARALAINPEFIVADEPVSALDVSVQAQVLNLLADLQDEFKLTYLFIAHNLATVQHISDRVAVMYLGKMVELATSDRLYSEPKHPYTQALLSAAPIADPTQRKRDRILLQGDLPSPVNPPSGCRFHTRCPLVNEVPNNLCKTEDPPLGDVGGGHMVACHLHKVAPVSHLLATVPRA